MHIAGYVHRDVSTGNILVKILSYGVLEVKLSDVEYAQKIVILSEIEQILTVCMVLFLFSRLMY